MKRMILFALLLAGTACSTVSERQSSQVVPVSRPAPVVYIHPLETEVYEEASVGVLPFRMPSATPAVRGEAVAALFRDVLLVRRVFPRVVLLSQEYGDLDDAVALGRKSGVDLVLAGKVNAILAGTELGGAKADLSVRLLNVATGNTVWHAGQTLTQPVDLPDTGIVTRLADSLGPPRIRPLHGAPPATVMLGQIASDLADVFAGSRTVRR